MARLRALGQNPELLVGLAAVAVFVVWARAEGGFEPTAWYPGALFILGLLVVVAIAFRRRAVPRTSALAVGCLGAFALWSFASTAWAGVPGDAWEGANRTLLYLTVFALFALPRWRASSVALLLGVYSVAIALIGAAELLDATGSDEPIVFFIDGRFAEPMGYHNADAALFLGAFWPALLLASRRETPWAARPVLLAAAGVLLELALLPQSRGSAIAFPITLAIYLIVVPDRLRSLVAMIPVAGVVALSADPLLNVYEVAKEGGGLGGAIDDAVGAVALSMIALLVIGAAWALIDARVRVSERTSSYAGRAVGGLGAVAGVVAVVLAVVAIGNPGTWARDRWDDFKSGYSEGDTGSTRFTGSLGTNRYDFWRVGLGEFASSPVLGTGADNFAVEYLRERRSPEESEQPHSFPVRVVSQTGIVGTALFGSFLILALWAAGRARRFAASGSARAVAGVAIVGFAYWFIHGTGDWFWVYPGLTAPALAWLAAAGRLEDGAGAPGRADSSTFAVPSSLLSAVALGLVAVVAAASYLLPWGAARDVDRASEIWATDPQEAYDRLDRARELDFLSERPDLLGGAIAARYGDRKQMRASFTRALERNPDSWYALLELGALDAVEGRRSDATTRLAEAQRLNPREPLIRRVRRGAESGHAVSLRRIDAEFLRRVCERVGRTETTRYCE